MLSLFHRRQEEEPGASRPLTPVSVSVCVCVSVLDSQGCSASTRSGQAACLAPLHWNLAWLRGSQWFASLLPSICFTGCIHPSVHRHITMTTSCTTGLSLRWVNSNFMHQAYAHVHAYAYTYIYIYIYIFIHVPVYVYVFVYVHVHVHVHVHVYVYLYVAEPCKLHSPGGMTTSCQIAMPRPHFCGCGAVVARLRFVGAIKFFRCIWQDSASGAGRWNYQVYCLALCCSD